MDKRPKKTPTKAEPTKKYLMQMFMKRKSNQPEAMQNFLSKTQLHLSAGRRENTARSLKKSKNGSRTRVARVIRKSGHKSKTPVKGSDLSTAKAKAANMSMLNMSFGKERQIQGTPLHTSKSTYDELSRMLMFKTGSKKGKIKNKPTMSDYLGY